MLRRAGAALGLMIWACAVAQAQPSSVFEPPKASYGELNIIRVDREKLGFYPYRHVDRKAVEFLEDPKTIGDDTTEARKAEIARIKAIDANVMRLGATLAVQLNDLSWLKFFDDALCGGWYSCQRYTFREYSLDRGYARIDLSRGGHFESIFVWLPNGRCVATPPGAPLWSPSRERFFSYGAIGPGAVVAQVVEMTPDGPASDQWLDDLDMISCATPEWIDDQTIALTCLDKPHVIERVDGKWRSRPR